MSEDIFKKITKEYGNGIIVDGNDILDQEKQIISVSPNIDLGLGGGIPEGSWVTLSGKPKAGKTTTALHFAANCQQPENGNRDVYYIDIEGRLKRKNVEGIAHLNREKFYPIKSVKGRILDAEQFLRITEDIARNVYGSVIIIDSVSMICSAKELSDELGKQHRAPGPVLLAQFCRQLANVVPINNNIIIGIMQMMANTSGYGKSTVEKGGNAIVYQADVRMTINRHEYLQNKDGQNVGQKVEWTVLESALGPPGIKIDSYIKYGLGVDELYESLTMAVDMGLIEKAGAWYECKFLEGKQKGTKFHGFDNLHQGFMGNEKLIETLKTKIDEMLQCE